MPASAKLPFGTASYSPVKHARYLGWERSRWGSCDVDAPARVRERERTNQWSRWESSDIDCSKAAVHGEVDGHQLRQDAFEVEFEDGLSFLEPHRSIRKANKITTGAIPASVELEPETRSGFFVHYHNGQTAEVSRSFIRELPPKK